ncbi:hypothetical protein FA95DRAFT_991062 [Auriscalpium vulgare]|uniref:Uncharacterized protein n=1 Tax=Auriscalpium vulgare TaxID=40419 RepID=A0ACB8R7W2_9AGAM|nr:hypothetical protein FA95DRAFT_991062 [Auriscalpium vulgare]
MPALERPAIHTHFTGWKMDPDDDSSVCWQMTLIDKGPVDPMDGAAHRFAFTCQDLTPPGTGGIIYAQEATCIGQPPPALVLVLVCRALIVKEPMLPSSFKLSAAFTPYADILTPLLSAIPEPFTYIIMKPEVARVLGLQSTALAEKAKEAGNRAYAQNDRAKAVAAYRTAEVMLVQVLALGHGRAELAHARRLRAVSLANCAAAYMLDGPDQDAGKALREAQEAEREDAGYIKGYLRQMRAYVALGDVAQARCALERARKWARGTDVNAIADALAALRG